jgi:Pentapeptide repeats (9 copies)
MTARSNRPDPPTPRPLSNWTIAAWALVLLAVVAVVSFVLLRRYGGQGAQIQLDAIRTAGTLVIGTGGAVALLLTARRQRYTELTLVHTTRDATERRITELYTKAADQLGSDKAPVRLAGLHALERLAQNTPEQRQTIVDVICAYLRMPYRPPDEQPPAEDAPTEAHTRYEQRHQELQVRLTAQRILTTHLKPNAVATFWTNIDLDLTEAHLRTFDLTDCHVRTARFDWAYFAEEVSFSGTHFTGDASFTDAQFDDYAWFGRAQFGGDAWFGGVSSDLRFMRFDGARVVLGARSVKLPAGWTTRDARPNQGEEEGWLYIEEESEHTTEGPGWWDDRNSSEAGKPGK